MGTREEVSAKEAASRCGLHLDTVYRWARAGCIAAHQIPRRGPHRRWRVLIDTSRRTAALVYGPPF